MKSYPSSRVNLRMSAEQAYTFLADFRNFQKILPEQISNWEADVDMCSFEIPMLGRISLVYEIKTPHSFLKVVPKGNVPLEISISCELDGLENTGKVIVDAGISAMQEMFLGRVMQNMADLMALKLSELTAEDIQ